MVTDMETGTGLTTAQAAALAGVSEKSIRNWIKAGQLPVMATTEGRRIAKPALLDYLRERAQATVSHLPPEARPGIRYPRTDGDHWGQKAVALSENVQPLARKGPMLHDMLKSDAEHLPIVHRPPGAEVEHDVGVSVEVGVDPPRNQVLAAPKVQLLALEVHPPCFPTAEKVTCRIPDLA